jgi:hypothetical protein
VRALAAAALIAASGTLAHAGERTGAAEAAHTAVSPLFQVASLAGSPFPTDLHTVADAGQATGLRVALPQPPDCTQTPSECADVEVLNRLDGFNLDPRLAIPFDGAIDVASVDTDSVLLIALPTSDERRPRRIDVDQVVWDPERLTLYAESDETLLEASPYALIVTTAVRDTAGAPIAASRGFERFRRDLRGPYKQKLHTALTAARKLGTKEHEIAVASVFTTQSVTPAMLAVRDHLRSLPAPAADFRLGPGGTRTVFARSSIVSLSYRQQTGTAPAFTTAAIGLAPLNVVPGAVGSIAYGRIEVSDFLRPDLTIEPVGTAGGVPAATGTRQLYFNLYLPSGPRPAAGWPVAVLGPGTNQNKEAYSVLLAAKLAEAGVASLGLNPVGRGFGPLSENVVTLTGGAQVAFLAGGRSSDRNGDGLIGPAEGSDATGPNALLASRDTVKQTILEHVQLAQAIEAGVDVDGDGTRDLDPARLSFLGWSFGSNYGVPVVAIEPAYRTAVFSSVGGPLVDNRRLGVNRNLVGAQLAARTPSLVNLSGTSFDENLPLRDRPPVVNTVPGAIAIQDYIDRNEWAQQPADIVPFAVNLRSRPLGDPREVLITIARGDQTVPNPAASRVIRAGGLEARTMLYRHDLAFAANPALGVNPHQFMTLIANPAFAPLSLQVEQQAAQFLASAGAVVAQPQPALYFEYPIPLPLPETVGFVQ